MKRRPRTFATTRSDRNLVTTLEYSSILDDGVVNLGLEYLKEAIFADLTARLWPFDDSFRSAAEGTQSGRHGDIVVPSQVAGAGSLGIAIAGGLSNCSVEFK